MRPFAMMLLMMLALPAQAEVLCPDSVDVQQQATVSGDWSVTYSDPPLRLIGVHIYDGPPSQNRRIKPHTTRTVKSELQVSWRLPTSQRNFHLACSYERTTATLTTLLPPGVNGCNAVFDRRVSYGNETLAVKRMVSN